MKKLIYLIVIIVAFGLIVSGCLPVVPPTEQDESSSLTKGGTTWTVGPSGPPAYDYTTIQAAIDAAAAGDIIIVAPGTYNEDVVVNKQLTLIGDPSTPSNVVVDALGTGTRPIKITADGCVLQGFKTINSESYYGSIGVWSNNNIIRDNIASGNSGSSGIFVYGSSYNTIENNDFSNNGGWGMWLYSKWVDPSYIACDSNIIKNNIANGNGQEGIGFGALATNNNIEDNQVNGNTYSGIGLFRSSSNTIKDNIVNQNGAIGINIYGTSADPCTNFIIIGNTVNNNGGVANIYLGGYCDNNTVENNTANSSTGGDGIRVSGNSNTIRNNTANGNTEGGMRLNGDNYTIEGNTCNLNAYRGIWLGGGGGSEVTNSIVKNNTTNNNNVGILLWTCHNSTLTGNTINDNLRYGIEIASNSQDNSMNYNNIVGNGTYGVINEGTTEVDATFNWWGDESGPHHPGSWFLGSLEITNPDGLGDEVSDYVLYLPWKGMDGFVTGGGWIDSPENGDYFYMQVSGKASFGFVSKYKKGKNVPDGSTNFVFQAGDLHFHSSSYDWLVVTGSDYAMFKGTGTINDSGEYKFRIWAGDGGKGGDDTFRIKIWEEDEDGLEDVVYDNATDQVIDSGSIIIHTK